MLAGIKQTLRKNALLSPITERFILWMRENTILDEGNKNRILASGARLEKTSISFHGSGNLIHIEPGASVRDCQIEVYGDHHTLHIGAGVVLTQSTLWFEDQNCRIEIGSGTTMQRFGHIAVTEPGRSITIGKNCMFSFNVDIRNGDSHSILERETGKRVNFAKNIRIGNHVWLGAHTQIIGGAAIEDHCIVGIRSLVNGAIPESSIAVGIPARVAKRGFTWDSRRFLEGDPGVEN